MQAVERDVHFRFLVFGRRAELRVVRQNGPVAPVKVSRNVDDECWAHLTVVDSRVEYFKGSKRVAFDRQLLQSGQEAAFITKSSRHVVVRVTSLPIRENHSARF